MAVNNQTQVLAVATNVSTETLIAVSPAITNTLSGGTVKVSGRINITAGAGTTAINLKVRQGNGLTGAILGPAAGENHTLAATASGSIAFDYDDASGAYAADGGIQYTVSVTQTGGTGAGTVNVGTINATAN